jgi:tetratricopeptide (TPR) repeat protein
MSTSSRRFIRLYYQHDLIQEENVRRVVSLYLILLFVASTVVFAESHSDAVKLALQASDALQEKDYPKCVELFERAFDLARKEGTKFFYAYSNAAICSAHTGQKERAFELLKMAIDAGVHDSKAFREDEDLTPLHNDPRWEQTLQYADQAKERYLNSINRELYELYEQDGADRTGNHDEIDWKEVSRRDRDRREKAFAIVKSGNLKSADDYLRAAFIFQHGVKPEDYQLAHELGLKASELDPTNMRARWIAAATKDRYLHSVGKPQIYGTQYVEKDGKWSMGLFDENAVTDEERAKWGVPALEEVKKELERLNKEAESKTKPE